jgi:N-methylhydantoinase B
LTFSGQGERFVNRPWGLFGGAAGACGAFELWSDGAAAMALAGKASAVTVSEQQCLAVTTPGAGGYGAPHERNRDLIAADIANEKLSLADARRWYDWKGED